MFDFTVDPATIALQKRVKALEAEVEKLKQKYHDADIPELRRKAGLQSPSDRFPY